MHIITPRLHLIPGTTELLRAELEDSVSLSALIGAHVPGSWPPQFYDRPAVEWTIQKLSEKGAQGRWFLHYFVLQSSNRSPDVVVGAGGYKGPPDAAGTVEIGYSILPEFQRKGFATEAVLGLTRQAFSMPTVKRVIAQTLEGDPASGGVLRKAGYRMVGAGEEAGTALFEITKADWKTRAQLSLLAP